jgi:hypothetical protein
MTNHQTFAQASGLYARYRPTYPPALFAYLAQIAPGHVAVWDCATGNGQAGRWATDLSVEQVRAAPPHPQVAYFVSSAESPAIQAKSCNLITVAQAAHWFDLDTFYAAARRCLRPGGVLAVWGYAAFSVMPAIDAVVAHTLKALDPYWAWGSRLLMDGYVDLALRLPRRIRHPRHFASNWIGICRISSPTSAPGQPSNA